MQRKQLIGGLIVAMMLMLSLGSSLNVSAQSRTGQSGTTLSASKTATGFWVRRIEYDWTLTKTANPTSLTLPVGSTASVEYTLGTTRTQVSQTDSYGVSGSICATNGGAVPTENLSITDVIQTKTGSGQFANYLSTALDLSAKPVLAPGESFCYPYSIAFTPVANALYRNVAVVKITNHSGWLPGGRNCPGPALCQFGPEPKADFSLPTTPAITYIDATASLQDVLNCPAGLSCLSTFAPQTLSDGGTLSYTVQVTNVNLPCNRTATLENVATLTETDTLQSHTAAASVVITTGPCNQGCTLTIGYWKNHQTELAKYLPVSLGSGGGKTVVVTSVSQAVSLLQMSGGASNGINKLYAQMLASKLNIARGASNTSIASTIAAADAFLVTKNAADWSSLSKVEQKQVLVWMTAFDDYNNGEFGPGHCG